MVNAKDLEVSQNEGLSNWHNSAVLGSHDRSPIAIERILVPTDLSTESERSIEYGFVLARRFGAHLTLLHIFKGPCSVEKMRGRYDCEALVEERMHSKKMLKLIAEEVKKHYPDCDAEFRDGEPCEEIVNIAKEQNIDLIVISIHHYNWLTRSYSGCDAGQILGHAPCPILVLNNKTSIS
jgi:nucleotide-binding universal stress UspA family protein